MITDRIDRITQIEEYNTILPAPKSVKIELSPRCNYRCGFCALRTRQKQPKEDMDLDLFKRITLEMKEAGVEEVGVFFLGESFMNPILLESAIRYLKQEIEIPYVFLTSNASLSTVEHVIPCMEAGLDSLKWSVNAADSKQFEKIMGINSKWFDRSLNNIAKVYRAREMGSYETRLYASSIKYDGEQQKNMENLLKSCVLPYVDQHYWLPLYSMGSFAAQREKELGYRPTAGNQGRLENLRQPIPCWSAFTEGHVRSDGGLSACCFDAGGQWLMGDLRTQSFMEAWNSQKFQDLREAHLSNNIEGTVCEDCYA